MRHFDVRLKLDDLVDSAMTLPLLISTIERMPVSKVMFWHNGNFPANDVEKFLETWKSKTDIKGEFCQDPKYSHVWFEIISRNDNKKLQPSHRFMYLYDKTDDVMKGILSFYYAVQIIDSDKKYTRRNKN